MTQFDADADDPECLELLRTSGGCFFPRSHMMGVRIDRLKEQATDGQVVAIASLCKRYSKALKRLRVGE